MKRTPYALAKGIHVPAPYQRHCAKKRGITADTAVRLAKFFGTPGQFWLGLQSAYEVNRIKAEHQEDLEQIQPLKGYAAAPH